jgi:phosphohistidine phosphatase SixA
MVDLQYVDSGLGLGANVGCDFCANKWWFASWAAENKKGKTKRDASLFPFQFSQNPVKISLMPNLIDKQAKRRIGVCVFALLCVFPALAADSDSAWNALKKPGAIVIFRHAIAPGGGDPAGHALNDCSTQRNLDEEGRAQARRIGERFREQGVKVDVVLSSQWCRTRETAQLAFPGMQKDAAAFNSFFNDRSNETQQTAAARKQLMAWRGPGALVVVTHQVNITALTGISPASGEGVVLQQQGHKLTVVTRLAP